MTVTAALKKRARRIVAPIPAHLLSRHLPLSTAQREKLKESIKVNFHSGWRDESKLSLQRYERELQTMIEARLGRYRKNYVPWIDAARHVQGMRILEIGCGTGASTVALAEQGAEVTAIDIDEGSLRVARDRATIYGVTPTILNQNACDLSNFVDRFDLVIYNACLEHMTIEERLQSLREGRRMLIEGGLLVIVETPNRLWWEDTHTSKLPMFHGLPDELAYQYASKSPRENFREIYKDVRNAASMEHFLRRGRGMSFHEVELAIGRVEVVSTLDDFEGWRGKLRRAKKDGGLKATLRRLPIDRACRNLLRRVYPGQHRGWHQEYLHLILRPLE